MSRYPITYWSESKKREFMVEELSDYHLIAGYHKLTGALMGDASAVVAPNDDRVLEALRQEIEARGLDPRFKSGKPPEEPRPDVLPQDARGRP